MSVRAIVASVLLLVVLAPAVGQPAARLEPLMAGWEHYFTLNWQAGQRDGRAVVYGHIANNWGFAAANVRLLVDGVDDRGDIVSQTITWLGTQLTPGTTAPFEVAVDGQAPSYQVSVFAYDWVQRGRGSGSGRGR